MRLNWGSDTGVIARRLAIIERHIGGLRDLSRDLSYESFLVDDEAQAIVERRLHVCLEALVDLGLRIISLLGLDKPERYRDLPLILASNNIIPTDQREVFERMISFRNVLVHLYAELDPSRVYEALQKLDDIERIARYIARFVHERGVDP